MSNHGIYIVELLSFFILLKGSNISACMIFVKSCCRVSNHSFYKFKFLFAVASDTLHT